MAGLPGSTCGAAEFSSEAVLHHGQVWRIVTYAFVHQPAALCFLLDMAFLFIWGREVERYFGRKTFRHALRGAAADRARRAAVGAWLTGANATRRARARPRASGGVHRVHDDLSERAVLLRDRVQVDRRGAVGDQHVVSSPLISSTTDWCSGRDVRWRFSGRATPAWAARRSTSWATCASGSRARRPRAGSSRASSRAGRLILPATSAGGSSSG